MTLPAIFLYPVLVTATTVTAATLYIYLTRPELIVQFYMRFTVLISGMKLKMVDLGDLKICYGERGRKRLGNTSILLLHGFSADKFMWAPLVKNLPPDYHAIALDLPGHGDSDIPEDSEDVSFEGQIKRLHQIIVAIGLDDQPFHIVGLSMGGALAGLYAAKYPQLIDRITMMCPAMKTPIASAISVKIREIVESGDEDNMLNNCPLIPKNTQEMQYMLEFAQFHKPGFIPKQILHGAVEMRKPYNRYFFRLFKALASLENSELLENTAHRITVPTQLVWGEQDQVIHVSGADVLKKKLPNCQSVDIIPQCGHAINLDRPGSKTKVLLQFRGDFKKRKDKQS